MPVVLTVAEAEAIAGTLSKVSAMPGYSYSLDARRCRRGSLLRAVLGSVCSRCYAMRGAYVMPHVRAAQALRHLSLKHPRWVDAMVVLINYYCRGRDSFFRWHDSGDLQSLDHLRRIVEVCTRTPNVRHWLPTREQDDVADFFAAGGIIPDNLRVSISGDMLDQPPTVTCPELAHLPTGTVQSDPGRVRLPIVGKGSIVCHATDDTRNECGTRRACWDHRVTNVSYVQH